MTGAATAPRSCGRPSPSPCRPPICRCRSRLRLRSRGGIETPGGQRCRRRRQSGQRRSSGRSSSGTPPPGEPGVRCGPGHPGGSVSHWLRGDRLRRDAPTYFDVVRTVGEREAPEALTLYPVGLALGLPSVLAKVVWLAAGVVRSWRLPRVRTPLERRSLSCHGRRGGSSPRAHDVAPLRGSASRCARGHTPRVLAGVAPTARAVARRGRPGRPPGVAGSPHRRSNRCHARRVRVAATATAGRGRGSGACLTQLTGWAPRSCRFGTRASSRPARGASRWESRGRSRPGPRRRNHSRCRSSCPRPASPSTAADGTSASSKSSKRMSAAMRPRNSGRCQQKPVRMPVGCDHSTVGIGTAATAISAGDGQRASNQAPGFAATTPRATSAAAHGNGGDGDVDPRVLDDVRPDDAVEGVGDEDGDGKAEPGDATDRLEPADEEPPSTTISNHVRRRRFQRTRPSVSTATAKNTTVRPRRPVAPTRRPRCRTAGRRT